MRKKKKSGRIVTVEMRKEKKKICDFIFFKLKHDVSVKRFVTNAITNPVFHEFVSMPSNIRMIPIRCCPIN